MTSASHDNLGSPAPVMRDASGTPAREAFVCACCGREIVVKIEGLFAGPKVGSPRRFCDHACRQAAYRRRKIGVPEDVSLQWRGGRGRSLRAGAKAQRREQAGPTTHT
jgi:hypothetical protein